MAALNQLIQLGQLNRLGSSVRFKDFPQLNITAPFLTKSGVKYTQTGDGVVHLPVMIGTIPSLEPFVMVDIDVGIAKTLPLAQAFQAQQQINSFLGVTVVRPDLPPGSAGIQPYNLQNVTIQNPTTQDFSGQDPSYTIKLRGYFPINSAIYP